MADGRCWKIFEMPQLACQWTDWDATWVVASHHVPNIGNAITPLTIAPIGTRDDSWVVASNQHICCKTVSLVLVVTANRTVNVLVLKTSTILMKLG